MRNGTSRNKIFGDETNWHFYETVCYSFVVKKDLRLVFVHVSGTIIGLVLMGLNKHGHNVNTPSLRHEYN